MKKLVSLAIALFLVLSVMPIFKPASATPTSKSLADDLIPSRKTGLKWIPPEEYLRLTGHIYPVMDERAFREALKYAPFYLGRTLPLSAGNSGNQLPSRVENTEYLPPVGNQGHVGSCVGWSSTYYVWTYMLNWWRNNPHPTSPEDIMNPTFTYNLINGGADEGSNMWDAMNVISTIGAVPLNAFPLYVLGPRGDPENYAWVWPNLTQWMMAPYNSGTYDMYVWQYWDPYNYYTPEGMWYLLYLDNGTQWNYLKGLLASGYVVQTALLVLPSFEFLNRPEDFINWLNFYVEYSKYYSDLYWTSDGYKYWTVEGLLDWVSSAYNETFERDPSIYIELMKEVLVNDFGVSLTDTIPVAVEKINATFYERFVNNQTWWDEAKFYLSAYSLKGEEWFVNNAFVDLYALANFEWMLHYIPEGTYVSSGRIAYVNFNNYYWAWAGGHAVTIIGYDDNVTTPDGQGALLMVNSWGTDWGDNGFWKYSYEAARTYTWYDYPYIISVRGLIQLPIFISYDEAFVYVPKAAKYKPRLMTVIGINHPYRGEVVDGIYNSTTYEIIASSGILAGVKVNNTIVWFHNYLDFWIDYISDKEYNAILSNLSLLESYLPQAHPFPESPMAFDVSQLSDYLVYYMEDKNSTPTEVTFYVQPKDILPDNFTGELYNFTLLISIGGEYKVLGSLEGNVSIPDGGYVTVPLEIPVVSYDVAPNNVTVQYGNFNVSIYSIIPLEDARIVIGNESYPLTAEEGGYYFYANSIAEKLKLHAGTYNYTVIVTYPNGKEVALPERTVTISAPTVSIISPEETIYNETVIPVKVAVKDAVEIVNVTAKVGEEVLELTYNESSGYYTGTLNLSDGAYTLVVTAVDTWNNTGVAKVHFIVKAGANVTTVTVENATVNVGVTGNVTVTVENKTVVANVTTSEGTYEVKVPVVNNVPSIFVNSSAIESVATGEANATLVAGWNASVEATTSVGEPEKEDGKLLYPVTITADVELGENGVAVIALRDVNISKIYLIKNGQKIQLTTNESDPIAYYYVQNGIVFVVIKQDPKIVAYGSYAKPAPRRKVSIPTLNFLGYSWYKLYSEKFSKLYEEAVELGVDNETLALALEYHQKAGEYYSKVLELSEGNVIYHLYDIRLLAPLRQAYVNEMKAVRILEKAIKELKGEE